jgi:hypothetical protein
MCASTAEQHSIFESIVSGKNRFSTDWLPIDHLKDDFQVKILKEASISHRLIELLQKEVGQKDKLFLLCRNVNMLFGHGVPKKIF